MNKRQLAGLGGGVALVILAGVIVAADGPIGANGAPTDDASTVNLDEDEAELTASEDATVTGTVDAPPGTEATVRLQSNGESPYLMSDTVTLDSDGGFEASFDLSRVETEHEATLRVTADGAEIERTITVRPPN